MVDLARLSLRVRPATDEASHSLLDRLALRHGYDNVTAFLDCVPSGVATSLLNLGRASRSQGNIRHARTVQHVQPESSSERTLLSGLGENLVSIDALPVRDKAFKIRRQVCCSCLREDLKSRLGPENLKTFRRKWWDLSSVHTCPFHLVYLTIACPHCGAEIDKALITPRHCRCGFDLSEAVVTHVSQADTDSDNYLVSRVSSRILITNDLLDPMPLQIAAACMAHVGHLATSKPRTLIDINSDPVAHAKTSARGYRALARGQKGLLSFLNEHTGTDSDEKYSSVAARYGSLYRWLYMSKHDCLDPIKDIVLQHSAENFARSGRKVLFGREDVQTSHITFGTAVRKWGVKYKQAYCIARSLGINLDDNVTLQTRVSTDDFQVLCDWLALRVDRAQAMTLLNIKTHLFDNIVSEGILHATTLQFPGRYRFFLKTDLTDLLQNVGQGAPMLSKMPPGCQGLTERVRLSGGVAEILKRLIGGSIKAQGHLQSCEGLSAVVIRTRDLETIESKS